MISAGNSIVLIGRPQRGTKPTGGFSKILICLPPSDREEYLCLFLRLQKDVEFKRFDTWTHHAKLEAHSSLINFLVTYIWVFTSYQWMQEGIQFWHCFFTLALHVNSGCLSGSVVAVCKAPVYLIWISISFLLGLQNKWNERVCWD